MILGTGRAIGEAIAVTQVIGGAVAIQWNIFGNGDTLASRIAAQYQAPIPTSRSRRSSTSPRSCWSCR
jgi:ABC-type phosphate transport system permease subunit